MFIPDPDFCPSQIKDPGVKKTPDPGFRGKKDTGSRIQGSKRHRIPDLGSGSQHCFPHSLLLLSSVSPTLSAEYSIYSYSVYQPPRFFPLIWPQTSQWNHQTTMHPQYHLHNQKSIANQLGRLTTITVIEPSKQPRDKI
jgi:hypothetical protein